ncbi:MAG: hypothetical protein ACRDVP_02975 [Acidimicrobiales bacterium]
MGSGATASIRLGASHHSLSRRHMVRNGADLSTLGLLRANAAHRGLNSSDLARSSLLVAQNGLQDLGFTITRAHA